MSGPTYEARRHGDGIVVEVYDGRRGWPYAQQVADRGLALGETAEPVRRDRQRFHFVVRYDTATVTVRFKATPAQIKALRDAWLNDESITLDITPTYVKEA